METWAQLSLRFDSGTDIQAQFPEDVRPKEREMCGGINCRLLYWFWVVLRIVAVLPVEYYGIVGDGVIDGVGAGRCG